jgi:hypothetical protein
MYRDVQKKTVANIVRLKAFVALTNIIQFFAQRGLRKKGEPAGTKISFKQFLFQAN